MIQAGRPGKNLARDLLDDIRCRPALLRWILHQLLFEHLAKLTLPGILAGQVLDPLHQEVEHLPPEVEHLLPWHLQSFGHFRLSLRHTRLSLPSCADRDIRAAGVGRGDDADVVDGPAFAFRCRCLRMTGSAEQTWFLPSTRSMGMARSGSRAVADHDKVSVQRFGNACPIPSNRRDLQGVSMNPCRRHKKKEEHNIHNTCNKLKRNTKALQKKGLVLAPAHSVPFRRQQHGGG